MTTSSIQPSIETQELRKRLNKQEADSYSSDPSLLSSDKRERIAVRPLAQGSWVIALVLTGLSLFTRLYKIGIANFVVW